MAAKSKLSAPLIAGAGVGAASASAADPFYTIRDVLEAQVKALQVKFAAWKDLLGSSNTSSDIAFRLKHDEVGLELKKTDDACRKLKTAVANMEKSRSKYPHVDDTELRSRKESTAALEKTVTSMKDVFNGRETKAKLDSDQKLDLAAKVTAERADAVQGYNSYTASNTDYLSGQKATQTQLRQEQDVALTGLSSALGRVGEMAKAIDAEVREHDVLINDIDKGVDEAQGKMDTAIKSIEKMLKTKDRCQMITICLLVLVFIIVGVVAFVFISK